MICGFRESVVCKAILCKIIESIVFTAVCMTGSESCHRVQSEFKQPLSKVHHRIVKYGFEVKLVLTQVCQSSIELRETYDE